ncbi:Uncharacterized protein dnm_010200 [Desulfonema magnum]|uniref:Uncharacterized protein n=1 Tax=Desulfonema magnum TaxID=45655 RepID=A0A975GKR2_9BACT|nr:Uncharacterized protein dnm_010200 [Desulfonema magnum]
MVLSDPSERQFQQLEKVVVPCPGGLLFMRNSPFLHKPSER